MHQRGDHAGHQQSGGGNRRDFETAQNILLAVGNDAHAGAEQARRQDAQRQHHGDHQHDDSALIGVQELAEDEKENQREDVVEKQHRAVAESEPQVHPDLRDVGVHFNP